MIQPLRKGNRFEFFQDIFISPFFFVELKSYRKKVTIDEVDVTFEILDTAGQTPLFLLFANFYFSKIQIKRNFAIQCNERVTRVYMFKLF